MEDSVKVPKISAKEVLEKQFKKSEVQGYDPDDVDNFLDIIVDTLHSYEKNFERYKTGIDGFNTIREKADQQETTIKKLNAEINDLYKNGYSNQAMMRRIQVVEENARKNENILNTRFAELDKKLSEMKQAIITLSNSLNYKR